MAQTVKNLPTMWEIWVQSPGWEDPLEKRMATHSYLENCVDREAWQAYSPWDRKESDMTERLIPLPYEIR